MIQSCQLISLKFKYTVWRQHLLKPDLQFAEYERLFLFRSGFFSITPSTMNGLYRGLVLTFRPLLEKRSL